MDPRSLDRIAHDLVVAGGVAPHAAVAFGRREGKTWRFCVGGASATACEGHPGSKVFDLASLTKPIVAATAARLTQCGKLDLGMPLGALVDSTRETPSADVPLVALLSHRAGLRAYLPLYLALQRKQSVFPEHALGQAASALRPECKGARPGPEGFKPLYSDLGYLLLGQALVSACDLDLDALVAEQVAEPLGLAMGSARQWRRRCPDFSESVAPTEYVVWRGGLVAGVVHDENAWALAGHGAAGHAGLFAAAESVVRFGAAMLDALGGRSDWLRPETARELVRPRPGGTLRAGFDGKCASGSAAGSRAGPSTFGHLGFTGTSLWCDPDAELVTVLLSNRVHPTRHNALIRTARPRVHDALAELAYAHAP